MFLVLFLFFLFWFRWPLAVATVMGGCTRTEALVRPGMWGRKPLSRAVSSVLRAGENIVAWP